MRIAIVDDIESERKELHKRINAQLFLSFMWPGPMERAVSAPFWNSFTAPRAGGLEDIFLLRFIAI